MIKLNKKTLKIENCIIVDLTHLDTIIDLDNIPKEMESKITNNFLLSTHGMDYMNELDRKKLHDAIDHYLDNFMQVDRFRDNLKKGNLK